MPLVRWKWVDYLNVELYEHNLHNLKEAETPAQPEAQTYYESDEEIFFDRLNHRNLERFMEELEFIRYEVAAQRRYQLQEQQRLMQQQYYTNFRILYPPPAYSPTIR
jgi:hypothetical protein